MPTPNANSKKSNHPFGSRETTAPSLARPAEEKTVAAPAGEKTHVEATQPQSNPTPLPVAPKSAPEDSATSTRLPAVVEPVKPVAEEEAEAQPKASPETQPAPEPKPEPSPVRDALRALKPLFKTDGFRFSVPVLASFLAVGGMVWGPHRTMTAAPQAVRPARVTRHETGPAEPRRSEVPIESPQREPEPRQVPVEEPLTHKAPEIERQAPVQKSAPPAPSSNARVEKETPVEPQAAKPVPAHRKVPTSSKPETQARKPVAPSASTKTAASPKEPEVVEPEEKAKRMAEARRLYVEAFGEMKKNPASAKAKFQKAMDLISPSEPLWVASMKWMRQVEEASNSSR